MKLQQGERVFKAAFKDGIPVILCEGLVIKAGPRKATIKQDSGEIDVVWQIEHNYLPESMKARWEDFGRVTPSLNAIAAKLKRVLDSLESAKQSSIKAVKLNIERLEQLANDIRREIV